MNPTEHRSVYRAIRTLRCLPLNYHFYESVQKKGLNAEIVFLRGNQYKAKGIKWFKNPKSVEACFRWLITIGVLRREVDGQGLTSKIRLTPLGRKVLTKAPEAPEQKPLCLDKFFHYYQQVRSLI